jgi:hypothetical protein
MRSNFSARNIEIIPRFAPTPLVACDWPQTKYGDEFLKIINLFVFKPSVLNLNFFSSNLSKDLILYLLQLVQALRYENFNLPTNSNQNLPTIQSM